MKSWTYRYGVELGIAVVSYPPPRTCIYMRKKYIVSVSLDHFDQFSQ